VAGVIVYLEIIWEAALARRTGPSARNINVKATGR